MHTTLRGATRPFLVLTCTLGLLLGGSGPAPRARATSPADPTRPSLAPADEAGALAAMEALPEFQRVDERTGTHYRVVAVWGAGDWAAGELGLVDSRGAGIPSDGLVVVAWQQDGRWLAAAKGTDAFNRVLGAIPDRYLDPAAKELLLVAPAAGRVAASTASAGLYKLPFACGANAEVVWVHSDAGQAGDVDFVTGATDLVAARDGWIEQIVQSHSECCPTSGCAPCNNYVVINHGDGEYSYYLHIRQWSVPAGLAVGTFVRQGDKIAEQGDVGWTSGSDRYQVPCQGYVSPYQHCGIHLHFGVHKGPYFSSSTVTPRFQDLYERYGSYYAATGHTYQSGNCAAPPPPPTDTTAPQAAWVSPGDGQPISSDRLHLEATASDDMSGVDHVTFSARWGGVWQTVATVYTPPYAADWDLCSAGVPDGDLELGLEAWDNAGNPYVYSTNHANIHVAKAYDCNALGPWEWHVECFSGQSLANYCYVGHESGAYLFKEWGNGPPASSCPSDSFSARLTRQVAFQGGSYSFHLEHDDGARLLVDGQEVIGAWQSGAGSQDAVRELSGQHEVSVEYYDGTGNALLEVWWSGPGALPPAAAVDPAHWRAEYWGNRSLAGAPALVLDEGTGSLDHRWGYQGPGYGLPADRFSARWQRTVTFAAGHVRFHLAADDGLRFWIDGVLALDRWQGPAEDTVVVDLAAGPHTIRLEYYESYGAASARLWWEATTPVYLPLVGRS